MMLTDDEINAAHSWAEQVAACTCKTFFDGTRYVVERHSCAYCKEWDHKLTELGITDTPREVPRQAPKRKRSSKAMRRAA